MKNKGTILIVDDEELIRETLEGLLLIQGHNLAFAQNGAEALAKAVELTPDLILLDVMMPDMDGFEVCEHLRADPLLAEVPIIMVTALDDRESRLQGIKVGADDFITKPFDSAELQLRVQTVVRLNRYRRLLMERNKFEWVVEQAEDGYLMLNENGQILYTNPQARVFLGLTTDDKGALDEGFIELARSQYHCEPEATWSSWPEQPPISSPRYLVRPESNSANSFWLQVNLVEMNSRSDEQYLIRLQNITDYVMAQKIAWTFHDQVSHKLRTPLAKLAGSLNLLEEDNSVFTAEDKNFILKTATSSVARLQDEITSIFKYMNTFNTVRPDPSRCSLAEIPAVIADLEAHLELKSLEVSYDGFEHLDQVQISTSATAVEIILGELIRNARKFHPEESPTLQVSLSSVDRGILLQVGDDGLTLSPEQLAKMWTPYYQAEKFFSGQVPGMGLGLSMVASLVWSAGGTCRAYNQDSGPGIVVEIMLPLEANSQLAASTADAAA